MASSEPLENQSEGREFVYWVDANNHVVKVNEAWREFAQENQVAVLTQEASGPVPLWNFIEGREMKYLFQVMLDKVRQGGGPLVVPFRCDAPDRRRFMEQTMVKLDDGLVEVRCRTLKEEVREPMALLGEGGERSSQLIYCCGWCKKFEVSTGKWVEVEHVVKELELFGGVNLPRISHGACPECVHEITRLLQ
ncbi:MAG: hypothetical protein K0Q55_3133 [Verrucomicrobia bacterium]|jgi:hypothetical protein|nr:hypothetical protein [Verrucomicrobiota bacterium]